MNSINDIVYDPNSPGRLLPPRFDLEVLPAKTMDINYTLSLGSKLIMVCIYIIIIIFIPLLLDYLFNLTIRSRRKRLIKETAEKLAISKNKSLVIFNGMIDGEVYHLNPNRQFKMETFKGNLTEIIDQMADDSCVVIVSYVLEYVDNIEGILEQLKRVSGNDLYIIGYETNSPRTFWDYQIKRILNKPYYLPEFWKKSTTLDMLSHTPNKIQINVQYIYKYIFKVVPYSWF